jgi:hypothetical protein
MRLVNPSSLDFCATGALTAAEPGRDGWLLRTEYAPSG